MKYQLELEINAPREKVIELFLDADNLKKWQPSLVSFEHLSGTPREVGAKSKQIHKMGSRQTEMIETITANNFPDSYAATYEAGGVCNIITNHFAEKESGKTHWVLDSEFKLKGFMWLIGLLFPGMFKKQSLTYMNYFKDFVEAQA